MLEDAAQQADEACKSRKPYVAPNIAALLKDYFKQFGNAGITSVSRSIECRRKREGVCPPKGYTDVLKSLWVRGLRIRQTSIPQNQPWL